MKRHLEQQRETSEADEEAGDGLLSWGLTLVTVVGGVTIFVLPGINLAQRIEEVSAAIEAMGWYGPLVFILFTAILTAIGIPRLLLIAAAGALFGVVWGLIWSQLATLLGAYGTFAIARWSGRGVTFSRWPKLRRFMGMLSERGMVAVLLIRQLPLSSFYINMLLGLSSVRAREFLLGSLLGFLPEAIPAVLIGAGVVQGELADTLKYILLGVVLFVVLGLVLSRFMDSAKVRQQQIQMAEKSADSQDSLWEPLNKTG
ncbi:MAG: TVP38/TMEM64 family protein [Gammaproteobacteria bacterium]|nr:TVP38/TMEM64 family protein [Gammaproteobacteria bacterium]